MEKRVSRWVVVCLKRERRDRVKGKGGSIRRDEKSERPGGWWCVLRERGATGLRRDGKGEATELRRYGKGGSIWRDGKASAPVGSDVS